MSYCRFSSDNFRSDVYCYEHCDGGFAIHVAGNKLIFPSIPDLPYWFIPRFGGEWSQELRSMQYPSRWHRYASRVFCSVWATWHRLSMWSLDVIPRKVIGLPHDGETLWADDAEGCIERLEYLRGLGYYVPKSAIQWLREEAQQ